MLIGQLSELTGFSRDTIRYYEKIGLLELATKRPNSGYRDYPQTAVQVLLAIRKYKELGFTLEEIRELLVLATINVLDIARLIHVVELKIGGIDQEIDKLHAVRLRLNREQQLLLHKKTGQTIALPELRVAA